MRFPLCLRSILMCAVAPALLLATGAASAHGGVEAKLKGYQEVPALATPATGRFKAKIDKKSESISYELSYDGLLGQVVQAHVHFGQRGVNGGIMVWLCKTSQNVVAPTCPQSGSVSGVLQAASVVGPAGQGIAPGAFDELVAAIRAGVAYVNVHSTVYPGGELRGQLRDDD